MAFVLDILNDPHAPPELRREAIERIHSDPGVPDPTRTINPFWLKDPHPTVSKRQSPSLPTTTVDYVLVGSGITATAVAHTLLKTTRADQMSPPSVVMLEARDACSGATGRNGGHMLESVDDYLELKESVGEEAAKNIVRFRLAHQPAMHELVSQYADGQAYSQLRDVEFVSVYFDEEKFKYAIENLKVFQKDMPEESQMFKTYAGDDLSTKYNVSDYAVGIVTGPAGAIWPYRLITMVLADLLDHHPTFSLETSTPITNIQTTTTTSTSSPLYTINTPRGPILARNIVHCSNSHIGHLVPGFRGRVFPLRGQMSAQAPGQHFPNQSHQHSWLFHYDHGFDYLTQLPVSDPVSSGEMMYGGGFAKTRGGGLEEIGVTREDGLNLYADIHLSGALRAVFGPENWGDALKLKNQWTGIMGFSADGFPWVGSLPQSLTGRESGGEWASVGFSGEGMVHAWLCGKALVQMMLEKEHKGTGAVEGSGLESLKSLLPEQFRITEKRIAESFIPKDG